MVNNDINFGEVSQDLISRGLMVEHKRPMRMAFPNAFDLLKKGLAHYVGKDARWISAYNDVAKWMEDTNNKGLALIGDCGLGKTIIGARIIPVIVNFYYKRIVNVYDSTYMAKHPDTVIEKAIIMVDDIGVEGDTVDFGARRKAFAELVDQCEKKGKLLIITSNLGIDELCERYGDRTIDRLKALTKCVEFNGESMRR